MRVCLVSAELAPLHGWGIGTYAAHAARALAGAGQDVTVLTSPHPDLYTLGPGLFPGVNLVALPELPARSPGRHAAPCLQRAEAVHDALQQLRPFDLIEFADTYAEGLGAIRAKRERGAYAETVLAVRLHSPIFVLRRLNDQPANDPVARIVERAEIEAIRGADIILSPSQAMIDRVEFQIGPIARPTRVIRNPFDAAWAFGPEHPLPRGGEGRVRGSHTILFLGRLEHRKGPHLLLDAAQHLMRDSVELRVRFLGTDTNTAPGETWMIPWLQGRIAPELADRFSFEGNQPPGVCREAIADAAAVCLPSLWENFPYAIVEAMALGTPVIVSDAGGMAELVRDGVDGLVFEAGNVSELQRSLRRAITDHALRRTVRECGPERVQDVCSPGSFADVMRSLAIWRLEHAPGSQTSRRLSAWSLTPISLGFLAVKAVRHQITLFGWEFWTLIGLVGLSVILGMATEWWMWTQRRKRITVMPLEERIIFEQFMANRHFWDCAPARRISVPYSQILQARDEHDRNGWRFRIVTEHERFVVPESLDSARELYRFLKELATSTPKPTLTRGIGFRKALIWVVLAAFVIVLMCWIVWILL